MHVAMLNWHCSQLPSAPAAPGCKVIGQRGLVRRSASALRLAAHAAVSRLYPSPGSDEGHLHARASRGHEEAGAEVPGESGPDELHPAH